MMENKKQTDKKKLISKASWAITYNLRLTRDDKPSIEWMNCIL